MAKRGKGGKKGSGDGVELTAEEQLQLFQAENAALKRAVAERQEEATIAIAEKKDLHAKLCELKRDFEDEQKSTFQVTEDLNRQKKHMQDELLQRIGALESTITELKSKLSEANSTIDVMKKKQEDVLVQKNDEIAEQKQRMQDMAKEFQSMLKETLAKMGEKIDVSSSRWDAPSDHNVYQVQQKLAAQNE